MVECIWQNIIPDFNCIDIPFLTSGMVIACAIASAITVALLFWLAHR